MKNIKALLLIVMLMAAGAVSAQFTQDRPNVEFMFKVEAGYLHNVGNYGKPKVEATSTDIQGTGYNLNAYEEVPLQALWQEVIPPHLPPRLPLPLR